MSQGLLQGVRRPAEAVSEEEVTNQEGSLAVSSNCQIKNNNLSGVSCQVQDAMKVFVA